MKNYTQGEYIPPSVKSSDKGLMGTSASLQSCIQIDIKEKYGNTLQLFLEEPSPYKYIVHITDNITGKKYNIFDVAYDDYRGCNAKTRIFEFLEKTILIERRDYRIDSLFNSNEIEIYEML